VTDNEYGVLVQHTYKFFGRAAAGSSKTADHILHHETPLLKNHSNVTGDFKN
jgi:hypothetical protein